MGCGPVAAPGNGGSGAELGATAPPTGGGGCGCPALKLCGWARVGWLIFSDGGSCDTAVKELSVPESSPCAPCMEATTTTTDPPVAPSPLSRSAVCSKVLLWRMQSPERVLSESLS